MKKGLLLYLFSLCISFYSYSQVSGFEENNGQIIDTEGNLHSEILFKTKAGNAQVYFKNNGVSYYFKKRSDLSFLENVDVEKLTTEQLLDAQSKDTLYFYRLDLNFLDAQTEQVLGQEKLRHKSNYYLGHAQNGIKDVSFYKQLIYKNAYPNIDIIFKLQEKGLKYDFVLHPGAKISDIKLAFDGADKVQLKDNILLMETPFGPMQEEMPESYQEEGDVKENVDITYKLVNGVVQFEGEIPNKNLDLIIDPAMTWSTYYNYDDDAIWGQEMDASSNQVVSLSITSDATMPTLNPGGTSFYQALPDQPGATTFSDLRILQFDNFGVLLWATYLGGSEQELVKGGIKINESTGNIYLCAGSTSGNFPTLDKGSGAYYDANNVSGLNQPVLVEFNSSGTMLWSTFIEGNSRMSIYDIDVASDGSLYLVGDNEAGYTIPINNQPGAYNQSVPSTNYNLDKDAVIIFMNSIGQMQWSTYFGADNAAAPQSVNESFTKVQIAPDGSVYMVGTVNIDASILMDAGGYFDNTHNGGQEDVLITKFSSANALLWSTYFGGSDIEDEVYGIGTDDASNLYISGITKSTDLPTLDPGGGAFFDNSLNGTQSGFLAKFNSNTDLVWSTYFGASGNDWRTTLDVSAGNTLYVAEQTNSTSGMPVLNSTGSYNQSTGSGSSSGFIASFDTSGVQQWGSYVSSPGQTRFICVRASLGPCGDQVYVGGDESAAGYPTLDPGNGEYFATYSGSGSGKFIITRFSENNVDPSWTNPGTLCDNISVNLNTYITGDAGGTWSGTGVSGNILNTTGLTGPTSITYTVGATGCTQTSTQVINIQQSSTDPTGIAVSTDSICPGNSAILTVSGGALGTGADWQWYSGSCGGTSVGLGTSISVSPTVTTQYFVRAEGTCGNTICLDTTIFVKDLSVAGTGLTASDDPVCIGDSTVLTVTGATEGYGADYFWYSGSCGGTFEGNGNNFVVYPTANTNYYVRLEGDCNNTVCQAISISTQDTSQGPTGIVASDTTICTGSFSTLSVLGGTLGTNANFEWYSGSCGGTPVGTGSTINVSPTVTTEYFVRAEGDCNNTLCVSLTIVVETNSTAPTSTTSSQDPVCIGDSTLLTASGGSLGVGSYYAWYTGGCGITLVDTGASIYVSPLATTTYYVRAEGNCNQTSCISIVVNTAAAGDASWTDPGVICESSGQINLDQFITGNAGGTWTGTNVIGSVFDPNGLVGQQITITYEQGNSPCIDQVSHTISVVNTISASWSSPITVCENEGIIDFNQYVTGTLGGTWSGTNMSANGDFDPAGLSGPINIKYVVGTAPCADSSSLQVSVVAAPNDPTVTVSDTIICEGDNSTIFASGDAGNTFNVYSDMAGATLVGPTDLLVTPTVSTSYYVFAEDQNGCNNGVPIEVLITVNPAPNASAGADVEICVGDNVDLTASGGGDYLWETGETTATINVSPSSDSTYTVTVTNSTTGCQASDDVLVNVINGNDITLQTDAETIFNGESVTVDVTNNDSGADPNSVTIVTPPTYGTASLGSGGTIIYTAPADFNGNDTIYYQACHPTCGQYCETSYLVVTVSFDGEVEIPTGFSPNGDGINDNFVILGINYFPEAELTVFNRWGEVVYQKANYNNEWQGEFNGGRSLGGNQVPEGTYFYVLKLGTGFDTYNGNVEVQR